MTARTCASSKAGNSRDKRARCSITSQCLCSWKTRLFGVAIESGSVESAVQFSITSESRWSPDGPIAAKQTEVTQYSAPECGVRIKIIGYSSDYNALFALFLRLPTP